MLGPGYDDCGVHLRVTGSHFQIMDCLRVQVDRLKQSLAAAQLENAAWRALAERMAVDPHSGAVVAYRKDGDHIVEYLCSHDTPARGATWGQAAYALARKLNLIAPAGKETT
jgi:hypothetical protein